MEKLNPVRRQFPCNLDVINPCNKPEVYISPNKCTYAGRKYLLKVLVVEVQTETSSRFPATVGCFLCSIY